MSFQQNLLQFDIAVIVLQASSNRLADLRPLAPKILAILGEAAKGQATVVSGSSLYTLLMAPYSMIISRLRCDFLVP
ncbi:MAG: hypothetical protein IGS39_20045 [Calothrix sp. C42_A2020_038]|nr:hypothetical protein [Calothrix sp. C42_A2020_038]